MASLRTLDTTQDTVPAWISDDDLVLGLPDDATVAPAAEAAVAALATPPDAMFGDIEIAGTRRLRPAWSPTRAFTEPGMVLPLAVRAGILRRLGLGPHDPALGLAVAEAGIEVAHLVGPMTAHRTPPREPSIERLDDHLVAVGIAGRVVAGERSGTFRLEPRAEDSPATTIVIPTAGAAAPSDAAGTVRAVEACLRSLVRTAGIREVLLVVGDEFRGDPDALRIPAGLPTRLVRRPDGPFDFAAAINAGVLATTSELVLLLNDDTEAIDADFLRRMRAHLADPSVGAVGAALTYPDGSIQHDGIVIDDAVPLHPFAGQRRSDVAPHGADVARDVVAVTGACVLARRRDLLAVGGLSTDFPLSFNDVDLCVRLRRAGFRVIVEPAAQLVHHETLTRVPVIDPWEWDRWIDRWGEIVDPWYHPGFGRPDDPSDRRRNADHLEPDLHERQRLDAGAPALRTTRLRSRVHHARSARDAAAVSSEP